MAKKKSFTDMLIKVFVDGSDKACKTVYVLVALFSIAVFASALALMLLPVTPDNLGLFQVITVVTCQIAYGSYGLQHHIERFGKRCISGHI